MLPGRAHVAYSAAKAGVIGLSKSVAIAGARAGVRCNTVVPGLMHTPLVEHRLVGQLGANDAAALIARRHAQVPMGRMGDAWDVAHAVLFLVSDEARYVTGQKTAEQASTPSALASCMSHNTEMTTREMRESRKSGCSVRALLAPQLGNRNG